MRRLKTKQDSYTVDIDNVTNSLRRERWKECFSTCVLKCFQHSEPNFGLVVSLLVNGYHFVANSLCEFFIRNALKIANMEWNRSRPNPNYAFVNAEKSLAIFSLKADFKTH